MKQKRELEQDIIRAEKAKQILNSDIVVEALTGMRETAYHNIRTSHFKAIEEREDLYKMLKAIDAFEEEFKRRIRGGQKAKSLLDKLTGK